MNLDRWVVLGLARPRSSWFSELAKWYDAELKRDVITKHRNPVSDFFMRVKFTTHHKSLLDLTMKQLQKLVLKSEGGQKIIMSNPAEYEAVITSKLFQDLHSKQSGQQGIMLQFMDRLELNVPASAPTAEENTGKTATCG